MNIFTEAAKLEEQNCPFAMAQIVDSRGSTPRHSAQMLVRADGSIVGTIGGGMVERKVIEESLQALQERKPRLFHGRMARNGADAVGSDCGGAMSVFISVHGMRPRLVLIGAGHVNRAIAQSAALLDLILPLPIFIAKASILNYSHHQPRFSMLSRLVRQWKHWIFALIILS